MYRRRPSGEIELFREPSHKANGNTLDRQGRLVTCEHATSRVTRAEPNGSTTVLATPSSATRQLNSPNDIVVATGGVDLLHRSDLRPDGILRRAATAGAVVPGRLPHRRRRRRV